MASALQTRELSLYINDESSGSTGISGGLCEALAVPDDGSTPTDELDGAPSPVPSLVSRLPGKIPAKIRDALFNINAMVAADETNAQRTIE